MNWGKPGQTEAVPQSPVGASLKRGGEAPHKWGTWHWGTIEDWATETKQER